MLLRIWNNWNSHLFIVAMQNYKATLENSLEVSYEIKYITYHSIQHGHFWFLPTKWKPVSAKRSFPGGSGGKESACNAGEPDSIPRSGRSLGEGNDNPLHYSCLENSMDRGAWWAMIHRVTKSWKWLSDFHFPLFKEKMGFQGGTGDKEPTCQCRRQKRCGSIPGLGGTLGGGRGNPLQYTCLKNSHRQRSPADYIRSMGLQRVWHNWSNLAQTHRKDKKNPMGRKQINCYQGLWGWRRGEGTDYTKSHR